MPSCASLDVSAEVLPISIGDCVGNQGVQRRPQSVDDLAEWED